MESHFHPMDRQFHPMHFPKHPTDARKMPAAGPKTPLKGGQDRMSALTLCHLAHASAHSKEGESIFKGVT